MTIEERSAPKALHDVLDSVWPLIPHGRRLGMGAQIVLHFDKNGNYTGKKVNLSGGDDKNIKPGVD